MTYLEMRNYVYHRLFQNSATEAITETDVLYALNSALYVLSAQVTHPLLSLSDTISAKVDNETTETLSNTFKTEGFIKKIRSVTGRLTEGGEEKTLTQVYGNLKSKSLSGEYQFQCYNNVIKTGEQFREITINGEKLLPELTNTTESLGASFPLGDHLAISACEYCMALLITVNITDGYNLSQHHEGMFNKMIKIASQVNGNIAGISKVKNDVQ